VRVAALLFGLVAVATLVPAMPLACTGTCVVAGSSLGFTPPVVQLKSGASIEWTSSDTGHVNADGLSGGGSCIRVSYGPGSPSTPVQLDIVAGGVVNGGGTPCATAAQLPDGSFVLPYYCVIHPVMRGVIVVSP
jgi:plastocyanin